MTTLVLEHLQHADSASPDITIDSNGRVGIGTTTPGSQLTVQGTLGDGSSQAYIDGWSIIGNEYQGNIMTKLNWAGGGARIQGFNSGVQKFEISANSDTYLNGGNVGIGTDDPDSRLHIKAGDSGYTGGIQIEDNDSTTKSAITHVNGTLYISSNTTDDHLAISSDGSVLHKNLASDSSQFIFNSGWSHEARNVRVWGEQDGGVWYSFIGTNVSKDGDGTYTKPSDNAGYNWGNVAGMLLSGANSSTQNAIDLVVDLPNAHGNTLNTSMTRNQLFGKSALSITAGGDVTTPMQPSFMAHKTSHLSLSGSGSAEGGGWSTTYLNGGHNTGGHFNTTSGRFTVPVAGRYKFDANIMHGITSGDFQIWLCVNGNTSTCVKSNSMQSTGGNWKQTTVTGIFNLAANDYISIFIRSSAAEQYAMYGSATAAFTTCNGYLIG